MFCGARAPVQQKMRPMSSPPTLDSIDRAILAALQQDARLSNQALAQQIHLSPSACLRRVKRLEDEGVIDRVVALLNPKAIGKPGTSYTIINVERMTPAALAEFEQAVKDSPDILDCFYVAGSNDYLLRFAYRDAEDLERVHTQVLMQLPAWPAPTRCWCCGR